MMYIKHLDTKLLGIKLTIKLTIQYFGETLLQRQYFKSHVFGALQYGLAKHSVHQSVCWTVSRVKHVMCSVEEAELSVDIYLKARTYCDKKYLRQEISAQESTAI